MLRSLRRGVAKKVMTSNGMIKICKRNGKRKDGRSYFATHWREFV